MHAQKGQVFSLQCKIEAVLPIVVPDLAVYEAILDIMSPRIVELVNE